MKLILVKHAMPIIDLALPAQQWRLSPEGRATAAALAPQLARYRPAALASSREPKASATAQIIAHAWQTPFAHADDLHEHDRTDVPFLDKAEFHAAVERFFAEPATLCFGNETADATYSRFSAAIDRLIAAHAGTNLIVFTHGTALSLFVARHNNIDPFTLWKSLALPSYLVVTIPTFTLVEIVAEPRVADECATE